MNPQLEELACLYVLDRLEASERAAFEARLLHSPQLVALVHELEATLSKHIHTLPQHEPPADLLGKIEARLGAQPVSQAPVPTRNVIPLWATIARWGIAAVIAVSVGTIAIQNLRHSSSSIADRPYVMIVGLDSSRSTLAELPMKEQPQTADARFIQLASLAEQLWEKPEKLPVNLSSLDKNSRGYALFDPTSNQGFIAIQQLPDIEKNKSYHLWILDTATGKTREAGVLPLSASQRGLFFFSVAPTTGTKPGRLDFFITAEDSTVHEPTQPRGKVVLGDKRI